MTEMVWVTRDGREIAIVDMADQHLLNTILLLRRRNAEYTFSASIYWAFSALRYAAQAPEGAAMAAEDAAQDFMTWRGRDELLAEVLPIFNNLLKEADRRGIEIPDQIASAIRSAK